MISVSGYTSVGGRDITWLRQLLRKTNLSMTLFGALSALYPSRGTLAEYRKREFYEKPSVRRKLKSEAARKRKKY